MKLKRIIALVLCVVSLSVMLIGCEEDMTQYWLDYYKSENKGQPVDIPDVDIDFYIIKGEEMSSDVYITKTVQDKINQYLYEKYNTKINIIYTSANDYAAEIDKFTSESSGIVLVNSEETMEKLSGKLVDLNPYLTSDSYASQGYGKLNTQIAISLVEAARVVENGAEKLYCIPNNHIIGSYEYIVINKAIASSLLYPNSTLAGMTSWDLTADLRADAEANLTFADGTLVAIEEVDYADYNPASGAVVTRIVNAPYEAKAAIEAENMIVNIAKYPAADKAEAYSSAFAILEGTPVDPEDNTKKVAYELYTERAMQVIYEINANSEIRNLLQYGVENVNYHLDENNIVVPNMEKRYDMNLLYTGDIFKALYSSTWSAEDAAYGKLQNKDSDK